jgi:hypothetical protein
MITDHAVSEENAALIFRTEDYAKRMLLRNIYVRLHGVIYLLVF